MTTLDLDGRSLNYRLGGAEGAPVLLFSNSLGTTLEMWDPQAEAFAASYRILRYDTRGHGGSSLSEQVSIEDLASDVVALLDALEIERVHFCGLSLGGLTGQALALLQPERLLSMTLANTSAYIPTAEMWNSRIAAVREGGVVGISEAVLDRWLTAEAPAELRQRLKVMLSGIDPAGYIAAAEAVRESDFRDRLGTISLPTLVIAAEQDKATPPAMGEALAAGIPNARLHLIQQAGHISNLEQDEIFTGALREHLTQNG